MILGFTLELTTEATGSTSGIGALPPAHLVRIDNPSRAAILHHEVAAELEPAKGSLRASDVLTVLHERDVPGATPFSFLLWKGLAIESISEVPGFGHVPGDGASSFEESTGPNPRAFWKHPPYEDLGGFALAREVRIRCSAATWPETLRVRVDYAGVIGDSLRAPSESYARSFETTAGLICDRGVYLASSSFWLPWRPDEVNTFRLTTDLPDGWLSVSEGAWSAPSPNATQVRAGRHLDRWTSSQPLEEVYLVAGPWTRHQVDHRGVAVQTFTYANTDSSIWSRYLDGTGRYIDLYGERFGAYPFPKFALVENFWQSGYGMPSFTLLGDRVIRLPFILDTSYGHEIVHNWWGNGVFVNYEEGNWCEGLTTYCADYFYKEREGPDAARQYRMDALKGYSDYVSQGEDQPLSSFRERHDFASQAVGYSKSLMVIHQLRRALGEERFGNTLRDFYERFLWKRASWSDLLASAAHSGRETAGESSFDAAAFREQWIERPGAPSLRLEVSKSRNRAPGSSSNPLEVRVSQEPAGTPFALVVPIRFTYEDGSNSTVSLSLSDATGSLELPAEPRIVTIEVDPDFEVMRRLDRAEIPSTLSETLGADSISFIIAEGLTPEVRAAYRTLADEWASGKPAEILEEPLLGTRPKHATWFLGAGSTFREVLPSVPEANAPTGSDGWILGSDRAPGGAGVVIAGRSPWRADRSWSALLAVDAAAVKTLGSKVPHYGKYSYLVVENAKTTVKGVWKRTASPLRYDVRP